MDCFSFPKQAQEIFRLVTETLLPGASQLRGEQTIRGFSRDTLNNQQDPQLTMAMIQFNPVFPPHPDNKPQCYRQMTADIVLGMFQRAPPSISTHNLACSLPQMYWERLCLLRQKNAIKHFRIFLKVNISNNTAFPLNFHLIRKLN